jgi:hypothetical protein
MKLRRKLIGLLGDDKGRCWHQSISPTTLARLLLRSQARCKEKPRHYISSGRLLAIKLKESSFHDVRLQLPLAFCISAQTFSGFSGISIA